MTEKKTDLRELSECLNYLDEVARLVEEVREGWRTEGDAFDCLEELTEYYKEGRKHWEVSR